MHVETTHSEKDQKDCRTEKATPRSPGHGSCLRPRLTLNREHLPPTGKQASNNSGKETCSWDSVWCNQNQILEAIVKEENSTE